MLLLQLLQHKVIPDRTVSKEHLSIRLERLSYSDASNRHLQNWAVKAVGLAQDHSGRRHLAAEVVVSVGCQAKVSIEQRHQGTCLESGPNT